MTRSNIGRWVADLSLAAGGLDLRFEFDTQFARAWLVKRFCPSQGLVQDPQLVFPPIRFIGDGTKFPIVISSPRRLHTICKLRVNRDDHRRNAALLYNAGN